MVDIYCERLFSTTSTALLRTIEPCGRIRVNSDSTGNYLDRWKVLRQNGTANPSLLLKNAPFTTALFPHVGGATDMHQRREENTHEDVSVHGMVGLLFIVATLASTTAATARDLTERAMIDGRQSGMSWRVFFCCWRTFQHSC